MASPTLLRPMRKALLVGASFVTPCSSTPSSRRPGVRAWAGQTAKQPPQPWHISAKKAALPPSMAMAPKRQISRQAPQAVQRAGSTCGTSM